MRSNHTVVQDLLLENPHYRRLDEAHHQMEWRIKQLSLHPVVEDMECKRLKRLKLRIRDEMAAIEQRITRLNTH